jgi:hypothetical protein
MNLSSLKITLHTGPPKTGTTTLQTHCFQKIDNIRFLGKPWFTPNVPYPQCVALHQAINQIWQAPVAEYEKGKVRAALQQYLTSRFGAILAKEGDAFYDTRFLLSEEGLGLTLTQPHHVIADRLADLFPKAAIAYVKRDPVAALQSGHVWVYARAQTDLDFTDWIRSGVQPDGTSPAAAAMRCYRYDILDRTYGDRFQTIRAVPFDDIFKDDTRFLTALLGVVPKPSQGFLPPSKVSENAAKNRAVAELHRAVKKSIRLLNRAGIKRLDEKPEYLGEGPLWQVLERPLAAITWGRRKFQVTEATAELIRRYYDQS